MKKTVVGITGGIGAGKSTVAKIIECAGFPVFYSDQEAKRVYKDIHFVKRLEDRWGNSLVDHTGSVDFKRIGSIVFRDDKELDWLNAQIHPKVNAYFDHWKAQQASRTIFKEAAILFESSGDKSCDKIITVEADKSVRIQRVVQRDGLTKKDVEKRMQRQLGRTERENRSDFTIINNNVLLIPQVMSTLQKIETDYV